MKFETYVEHYEVARQAYDEAFTRFEKFEDYVTDIDLVLEDIKYSAEYQRAKADVMQALDAMSHLNSLVSIDFVQQQSVA